MNDRLNQFLQDLTADLSARMGRAEPTVCWFCGSPPPFVRRAGRDLCESCDAAEARQYRQEAAEERERNPITWQREGE